MTAFVTAGAGFLLAVLWFDLMFDVQALRHRGAAELPGDVLASTSAYYRRVTTAARPMNRLVGLVMLATLASIVLQIAGGDEPRWVAWASLAVTAVPVGLAAGHTFPAAVRLGAGRDPGDVATRLARSILRDHLICFAGIATLMALQLGFAS